MAKINNANADPKKKRLKLQIIAIVVVVLFYLICHVVTGGKLLSSNNLVNVLTQICYPLIVSLGMMFIFSGGMVDLSIGAQAILAGNVGAVLVTDMHMGYPGLIIGTIVALVICELLSASCSQFLGIPAWVAGLGAALVYESIAQIYVDARSKTAGVAIVYMETCNALGQFPVNIIIAALVVVVTYIVFNRTKLGFNLQAVGGGGEVAEAMGINRKKTVMIAAGIGAVIIAIGVIVQLSYTTRFTPSAGMASLSGVFKSLAILLIAGSFRHIFNDVIGCLVGSFVVGGLFNVLTLIGVPSGTGQDICLGAVVLLCGILSSIGYKGVQK